MADPKVTFFHLPRELRDFVYDHAFGLTQRSLSYAAFTIIFAARATERSTDTVKGLPQWLLTSQLICKEAIDLLLRTRWVSPHLTQRPHDRPQVTQVLSHSRRGGVATCSPVRQSLLFRNPCIRNIALDMSTGSVFTDSLWFFDDTAWDRSNQPWTEFLHVIRPFVSHSSLRLDVTIDAKSLAHSIPYIDWPEEWMQRIDWVDVALMSIEEESGDLKETAAVYMGRLIGCNDARWMQPLWTVEPVYEEPSSPPCKVPGGTCSHSYHHRQRSDLSRYCLRMAAQHAHPAERAQPHSRPGCRLFI